MAQSKNTTRKHAKTIAFRWIVNSAFVLLLIFVAVTGSIQFWFLLFAVGLLASTIFGRLYCGWMCPMHTLMRPIDSLFKTRDRLRLHQGEPGKKPNRRRLPQVCTTPVVRYGILLWFISAAVSQRALGTAAPIFIIITGIALLFVLFYEERSHTCGEVYGVSTLPNASAALHVPAPVLPAQ